MLKIFGTAVAVHAVASALSVGRGLALSPVKHSNLEVLEAKMKGKGLPSEAETARLVEGVLVLYSCAHPERLDSIVSTIYSKDGTFEDPAARCGSPKEITEAFRALAIVASTERHFAGPAVCRSGKEGEGCSAVVEMPLSQSYKLRGSTYQAFRLESTVLLKLQHQGDAAQQGSWRIVQHQEWWGNRPLLWAAGPSRWLNGVLSYALTTMLTK